MAEIQDDQKHLTHWAGFLWPPATPWSACRHLSGVSYTDNTIYYAGLLAFVGLSCVSFCHLVTGDCVCLPARLCWVTSYYLLLTYPTWSNYQSPSPSSSSSFFTSSIIVS
jgi:hypothetical protein